MSRHRHSLHGGPSRTGEWKRRRARRWSHQLRAGGAIAHVAAKRLAQRGHALKLVEKRRQRGVLDGHMRMMRLARTLKREERKEARRLPERLTTVREVNMARAQYGTGPVSGTRPVRQLLPGERCDYPVVPLRGCVCPQCRWTFGKDIEPHPVGGVPMDIAPCGYPGCLCGGWLPGHTPLELRRILTRHRFRY